MSATLEVIEEVALDVTDLKDNSAISRIASRVELETVELVEAHFKVSSVKEAGEPDSIAIEMRAGVEGETLSCFVSLRTLFEGVEPGSDEEPLVMHAGFRVDYRLQGDEVPDIEDIGQFVRWNVLFITWPYWREFVQSMSSRSAMNRVTIGIMGLPV